MRTVLFTKSISAVGGVEQVVDLHCKWLIRAQQEVLVIALKSTSYDNYHSIKYKYISKCKVKLFQSFFNLSLGTKLLKELLNQFQDSKRIIVHQPFLNGLIVIVLTLFISKIKRSKIPQIYFFHHAIPSRSLLARYVYFLFSWLIFKLNTSTKLISTSYSKDNSLLSKLVKTPLQVVEIPIPNINRNFHKLSIRNTRNAENTTIIPIINKTIKSDVYIATYVGRIAPYKGLLNLIKSVIYIKSNIIIVIAGDGKLLDKVRNLINKLPKDAKNKVFLIPKYIEENDKFLLLSKSDFFLFPSIGKSEAYGIAQLEALNIGLPIVNTYLGTGVNSVAKDGEQAITCFRLNNPKRLASCIDIMCNSLTNNKKEFNPLTLRSYTLNNFSEEKIYTKFKKELNLI